VLKSTLPPPHLLPPDPEVISLQSQSWDNGIYNATKDLSVSDLPTLANRKIFLNTNIITQSINSGPITLNVDWNITVNALENTTQTWSTIYSMPYLTQCILNCTQDHCSCNITIYQTNISFYEAINLTVSIIQSSFLIQQLNLTIMTFSQLPPLIPLYPGVSFSRRDYKVYFFVTTLVISAILISVFLLGSLAWPNFL